MRATARASSERRRAPSSPARAPEQEGNRLGWPRLISRRNRVVRQLVGRAERVAEELRHGGVGQLLALWRAWQLDAQGRATADLLEQEDGAVAKLGLVARQIGLRAAGAHGLVQ